MAVVIKTGGCQGFCFHINSFEPLTLLERLNITLGSQVRAEQFTGGLLVIGKAESNFCSTVQVAPFYEAGFVHILYCISSTFYLVLYLEHTVLDLNGRMGTLDFYLAVITKQQF